MEENYTMTDSPLSRHLMASDWKGSRVNSNTLAGGAAEEEGERGGGGT